MRFCAENLGRARRAGCASVRRVPRQGEVRAAVRVRRHAVRALERADEAARAAVPEPVRDFGKALRAVLQERRRAAHAELFAVLVERHAGFRAELPAEVLGRIAEPLGGLLETQRLRSAQVVADLADHRGAVRGGVLPGAADQRAEQQLGKAGHQQRLARLRVPRVAADRIEKLLEAFALCFEHAGGQRGPLAFVSVQKILRAVHDVDLAALGRKRLGGVDIARADDDDLPEVERQDLRVLRGEKPERVPLFELFMNDPIYTRLAGHGLQEDTQLGHMRLIVDAMAAAGYDYATCNILDFHFPQKARAKAATESLNGQATITDWETFEAYKWPNAAESDYTLLEKIKPYLPEGMKLMVMGPCGVLENVISLVGYDNLCYMLFEEPELVQAIFDHVGAGLVSYYEQVVDADTVGFLCSNDDWGFNTQTFLSTADMRKYVFPWHKKIVEVAHSHGKPYILHSCGYFNDVLEDVIEDMQYDGRHSYEDNIMPVEEAYELMNGRIAVLGGIDMNFLVSGTPEAIYDRARAMLERTADRAGYMLGSGNSIPEYVPHENYLAMIRAALDMDR